MPRWRAEEIAYCANVHPGTSANEIENNIRTITQRVRETAQLASMSSGLWVCEQAVAEYASAEAREMLKTTLEESKIFVTTLNGFPLGDFHQAVVKDKVYFPNWSELRRLDYSKALADLLADILPAESQHGTISTLPLGYRREFSAEDRRQACEHLCEFTRHAHALHKKTGKHIRLCLEMEPGCVLETSDQLIHFFTHDLRDCCDKLEMNAALVFQYLGACYDICHQAVMQEDIRASLNAISEAKIVIGKIQVSSALRVFFDDNRSQLRPLFAYAEPKYMHQLTARANDGERIFLDDLSMAFEDPKFLSAESWNIHFHLPIHTNTLSHNGERLHGFSTTRDAIHTVFDYLAESEITPHIEIETYTWEVLPDFVAKAADRKSLVDGLVNEHKWLVSELSKRNLLAE